MTASPKGLWRRCWHRPLHWHAAALFVVLLGALALTLPLASFTTDEGSAVLQARQLEDGWKWRIGSPPPSLDPAGDSGLILNADVGSKGRAFYSKHALYPILVAGADLAGGRFGMFLISIIGTVGAGYAAALLARRLRPELDRPTLWITGLASPLFFYSFVIVGHTLLAALTGFAAVAAINGKGASIRRLVAIAFCCALAGALRSEGLFVGPALGIALASAGGLSKSAVLPRLPRALAAVGGTIVGATLDRLSAHAITGNSFPHVVTNDLGFLPSRWSGLAHSGLSGSMDKIPSDAGLAVATVLLVLAAVLAGTPTRARPAGLLVAAAGLLYLLRGLIDPRQLIPGLVPAFPLGVFALIALRRRWRQSETTVVLTVASTIGLTAVVLTQYSGGGGLEWGGRYFAFTLPLLCPLVALSLAEVSPRLGTLRRAATGGLVVSVVVLGAVSLAVIKTTHPVSYTHLTLPTKRIV